jgi:hypothetical protein
VPTQKLRVLALTSLLLACAPLPPKAPGDSRLTVGESPAPLGYEPIGRIEGTHGKGCGVFGGRGNAEGAMQALRNAALARGADYLQVTKVTEPTADRNCVSHVYKAEGIAYRKRQPPKPDVPKAPRWELLYSTSPSVSVPHSSTRLTPPEQAKLLRQLFDRYIESGVCAPLPEGSAPPSLEAAREAGQFRPAVGDAVSGAFTAPHARELLLLVYVGECHASAEDLYGTRRLVVLQGDTPVLNVETDATHLAAVKDVDLDGTLEVVSVTELTKNGALEKRATLLSLRGGTPTSLEAFGQVYEDTCSGPTPGAVKTTVVKVLPGPKPEFGVEPSESACPSAPSAAP